MPYAWLLGSYNELQFRGIVGPACHHAGGDGDCYFFRVTYFSFVFLLSPKVTRRRLAQDSE
jgi:hypothetical protein